MFPRTVPLVLFLIFSAVSTASPQPIDNPHEKIRTMWLEWAQNNRNLSAPDMEGLEKIKNELLNAGITSHPYLTIAILREAERRAAANYPDTALNLLNFAKQISNDRQPEPYFFSVKIYLKYKREFSNAIGNILDGMYAYFRNMLYFTELAGNISVIVLFAGVISVFVFVIILLIKYLKNILHDFGDLFPDFVPRFASGLLGLTIVLIPVIFNLGFAISIVWWVLLVTGYTARKEKWIMTIPLLTFVVFPIVVNFFSSFITSASRTGLREMELIRNGYWDHNIISSLEKIIEANPTNWKINFSLASALKKAGKYEESLEVYQRMDGEHGKDARVLNNIGNIFLAQNRVDEAIVQYKKALEENSSLAAAHYNLGQVLVVRNPFGSEAEESLSTAKELAPKLVSFYTRIFDGKNINRRAIDSTLTLRELLGEFFSYSDEKIRIIIPLVSTVTFLSSAWAISIIGITGLLGLVSISFLSRRFGVFSASCHKCNRVYCPRCKGPESTSKYCNECESIYITKTINDPKVIMQIEKNRTLKQTVMNYTMRFLNLALPGSGIVYHKMPIAGFILMMTIFSIATRLIFRSGIISYHLGITTISPTISGVFLGSLLLIFFLIAQIIYYRNE